MNTHNFSLFALLLLTACASDPIPCDGQHRDTRATVEYDLDILEPDSQAALKRHAKDADWFQNKLDKRLESRGHHHRVATHAAPSVHKQILMRAYKNKS